ncbi:MAG: vWA domain-containing protein [Planctomycetota bacterium]
MVTTQGDRTHFSVILDRTGSMESIRQDTIGGFNGFLREQQAQPTPATFTLVQFDSQAPYEVLHSFTPIGMIPPLTEASYVPRAGTPLFDAIGRGITDLEGRLEAMPADQRPAKVVFVIVTDGHENASREFTGRRVKAMIEARRRGGWNFVFLSADEQAIPDGDSVGIDTDYSLGVAKSAVGSGRMWRAVSQRAALYRSASAPDMSLREIKERLAKDDEGNA